MVLPCSILTRTCSKQYTWCKRVGCNVGEYNTLASLHNGRKSYASITAVDGSGALISLERVLYFEPLWGGMWVKMRHCCVFFLRTLGHPLISCWKFYSLRVVEVSGWMTIQDWPAPLKFPCLKRKHINNARADLEILSPKGVVDTWRALPYWNSVLHGRPRF